MVKEYVMLNKEKVLSALYQLNTEVSKQDLAELLGIDHRNLTRYWKESVQLNYIKTWKVQTGRTSYVMLQITPLGIKEAKKLPKQVDLKDVVISEPEIEPEIEITPEMKVKGKAKLKAKKEAKIRKSGLSKIFLNALDDMYNLKKEIIANNDKYYEMSWNNFQSYIQQNTRKIYNPVDKFFYDKTRDKSEIQIEREAEALKELNDLKHEILHYTPREPKIKQKVKYPTEIEFAPISIEKKKLKFELMTYCSKLAIRMVDCKLFGFKNTAEMRAKIMMLISEL